MIKIKINNFLMRKVIGFSLLVSAGQFKIRTPFGNPCRCGIHYHTCVCAFYIGNSNTSFHSCWRMVLKRIVNITFRIKIHW